MFLLGASILIIFSYVLLLREKLQNKEDLLLGSFTLFNLQIIAVQLLLGTFGKLNAIFLCTANLLITLAVICRFRRKLSFSLAKNSSIFSNNTQNILFFQLILAAYGFIIFLGSIIPPYAWDSITYHLPTAFHWIKAQKIFLVQPLCATSFFPMNGSLLMIWLYLGTNNISILNLTQIPFAFLMAFGAFNLARKLNIQAAAIVIPVTLLTPVVMLLCSVAYVDIIFSCFIIMALNFIIGYFKNPSPSLFLLSCAALGLSSGIKPGGFWLFPALAIFCYHRRKYLTAKLLFSGILLVIAGGGFWYIRNFALTGNPVFPYTIKFLAATLFKGIETLNTASPYEQWFVTNRWEWVSYPLTEKIRGEFTYSIENGFGMQFVLGIISVCYAIYLSLKNKDNLALFVFLIFPLSIIFWFLTSTCPVPRYIIFLCPIAAISIAYVHGHLEAWQKHALNALIAVSLSFSFITTLPILIPHQAKVLHSYLQSKKLPSFNYYKWEYGPLASAWEWIDKNIKDNSVIACNYDNLTAPLFGNKLQHDVIHIITYKTAYAGKLKAYSYEEFKQIVDNYNISYILNITPYWESKAKYSNFRHWAILHPEKFKKIKSWNHNVKEQIVIYKVNPLK